MKCQNYILKTLYINKDAVYKDFSAKLIPNISSDLFIGVRTQNIRKIAKDLVKSGLYNNFIEQLPHKFFEENQLHAFVLSEISGFEFVVKEIERFLPYVDNWATCDQMSPKAFKKKPELLIKYINKWIKSKYVYAVRFGILCLMRYFLDDKFDMKYVNMVADIKSDEYYINMMRAWYFATAIAKHFVDILPYLQRGKIDEWTRLRAIQKSLESYRVSDEHKKILSSLR